MRKMKKVVSLYFTPVDENQTLGGVTISIDDRKVYENWNLTDEQIDVLYEILEKIADQKEKHPEIMNIDYYFE
jgi:hypothetical protein